jgi:integrase
VQWDSALGLHLRALLALATSTGMRLSELVTNEDSCCILRGSCSWIIAGVVVTHPTVAQLRALTTRDFLVIVPPPSKADQFGIIWGSLPIYIPFRLQPGNAVALVAQIFIDDINAPARSPLLTAPGRKPLTHYFLRRLLPCWLLAIGIPERQLAIYRWHSARVFLACALLAAGRRPDTIQALLRWQSVESLRLYSCLGPAEYAAHLDAARGATVSAMRAAHIPFIESLDLAFHIHNSLSD